MYSFFKCFCFIWILKNVQTETNESMFNTMALGHSSLLVYWKPIEYSYGRHVYHLTYGTTGKGDQRSYLFHLLRETDGQYMITSLAENTEYDITIKEYDDRNREGVYGPNSSARLINKYTLKGKTDLKTNSAPAKPDMKFDLHTEDENGRLVIKIMWIPCGMKRVCEGRNSGTHFLIKYRCIESRKTITRIYTKEYEGSIIVFHGKMYEVVVTSVNGDFQTDSDPQEFFLNPASSSVRYVKVLPLNESSVMISWKAPKESSDRFSSYWYFILACARLSDDKEADVLYEIHLPSCKTKWSSATRRYNFDYEATVISNLTAGVSYTFAIVPRTERSENGIEYLINYIPQVYDDNLPVAVPDINYDLKDYLVVGKCMMVLQWLPCGKMFDCHNTKPGYNYSVEYKKATDSLYSPNAREMFIKTSPFGENEIVVDMNQTYDLKVISARGSVKSAPFLKKITTNNNCEKIGD